MLAFKCLPVNFNIWVISISVKVFDFWFFDWVTFSWVFVSSPLLDCYPRHCEYYVMEIVNCVIFFRRLMCLLFLFHCIQWQLKSQFSSFILNSVASFPCSSGISQNFGHMFYEEFTTFSNYLYFWNSLTNFQRLWSPLTLSFGFSVQKSVGFLSVLYVSL